MSFDDLEKELEKSVEKEKSQVEIITEELDELKRENVQLKKTLFDYGIDDKSELSDEEFICIVQIERLSKLSEKIDLSEQEVRIFDILNKNLRMIRTGSEKKTPKSKNISKAELLKIVDGGKAKNE